MGRCGPRSRPRSAILKDGMERRGIELVLEVQDDLPPVACGQGDLEQVFLNLLTNAREAMPRGGRSRSMSASGRRRLAIAIADTGCGIPPEHLPRVLEPFFTTKAHGNGLGLSICRSILWEVGGTHRDPERARQGHARRRRAAGRLSSAAAATFMKRGRDPGRGRRIRHAPRGRARPRRRAPASSAADPRREAVAAAAEFNPDLVILDIRMPELDGFELMARLKAQLPALDIILMTGSIDDLDRNWSARSAAPPSTSSRSRSIGRCC